MNVRHVISRLGLLFIVLSGIMILMAAAYFIPEALRHHQIDPDARMALFISGVIGVAIGFAFWITMRKGDSYIGRREALLLVSLSWTFGAAIGALPFYIWAHLSEKAAAGQFAHFIDCYFETMSGLTTTGATILHDIEAVPRSLLFWRAITHWLGGLGIVVLFVAVLPTLGVGGKKLFRVEAPGPSPEGLQPQVKETARVLAGIYIGLTVLQVAALKLAGMSFYDSVLHTFATLATGGFSPKGASVGYYGDTPAIDFIVIVFMVLAGANFGLYYQIIRRKHHIVWQDAEFRFYLILLALGTVLVFISVYNAAEPVVMTTGETIPSDAGTSLRQSLFTTVSIQTTTGFCTSDFNRWPFLAQGVLILLMFIGGCSGSTGGGIKVIRIWIALKIMISEIERAFRPSVVRPVRVGNKPVDADLKLAVVAYVLGVIILFAAGSGAIMIIEGFAPATDCDYTTAATASVATLCTIGPGLAKVGAIENYGWFTGWSKGVLCILMMLGRLEVFAIIVLFSPRYWRGN